MGRHNGGRLCRAWRRMTDFWRLVNALIVIAIVLVALFLGHKRRQNKPAKPTSAVADSERLLALQQRKQKLTADLEHYTNDVDRLEAESRHMLDTYWDEQENQVRQLVRDESRALLDAMHADARETLDVNASAAKDDFVRRLNTPDH